MASNLNLYKIGEIKAKKSLGQNFLIDNNILSKIAKLDNGLSNSTILEIGPGMGALTKRLLKNNPRKIYAIEKDRQFLPYLNELKDEYNNFEFVIADALNYDYRFLLNNKLKIFSNLPYNIATKLLVTWLKYNIDSRMWETLILMFQKEVAQRIVADIGSKSYGRLSLLAELMSDVEIAFDVPKNCFSPKPRVASSLVKFTAIPKPRYSCNFLNLEKIIYLAFNQRRKVIKNSLKPLHKDVSSILTKCNISPLSRAEVITLRQYCDLSLEF